MRNIQDTGIRGYLKWLQCDQPGIYARAAPIIAQQVPEAFSDREQSMAMAGLMGFADEAASGVTTFFGDAVAFDDSASVPTSGETGTTDVASAANSGAASSATISAIGNIVNSVAQYFLNKQQAELNAQVNAPQLQRAGAGLTPGATSSASVGVPQVQAAGVAGGTVANVVMVGLVSGLLLYALMGKGRRS